MRRSFLENKAPVLTGVIKEKTPAEAVAAIQQATLHGANVSADDLRAGAAMVVAGLCAKGTTEIDDIFHIQRGYEDIVGKLQAVGADIKIVTLPD